LYFRTRQQRHGQVLLAPSDVQLRRRVGRGAFGEVFLGECCGAPEAVKTMLDVTDTSAREFRAEILLTAALRHPNVIGFVGCCWGGDLTCLVLEWAARGNLGALSFVPDPHSSRSSSSGSSGRPTESSNSKKSLIVVLS
jgi:serine/threonine protein kinase